MTMQTQTNPTPTIETQKVYAPDFFIVGAPKCGTTALYSYLNDRKDVFMPNVKEPRYFADDMNIHLQVNTAQQYSNLFKARRDDQTTGEASVWYLYSETAIKNIMKARPDAMFIAMVRNPIDMMQSLHREIYNMCWDDIEDVEKAWDAQDKRAKGLSIPKLCKDPKLLQYHDMCALGSQLERMFQIVPESQRLVLVFDDFAQDAETSYRQACEFLGLPSDNRTDFPPVNEKRTYPARGFVKALRYGANAFSPLKKALRRIFPDYRPA